MIRARTDIRHGDKIIKAGTELEILKYSGHGLYARPKYEKKGWGRWGKYFHERDARIEEIE